VLAVPRDTTGSRLAFEHHDTRIAARELGGRRQPRRPAPDDDDIGLDGAHRRPSRSTST
jgi:hypothetical protein